MDVKCNFYVLEEEGKTYLLSPEDKDWYGDQYKHRTDFENYRCKISKGACFDVLKTDSLLFGSFGRDKLPNKYRALIEQLPTDNLMEKP